MEEGIYLTLQNWFTKYKTIIIVGLVVVQIYLYSCDNPNPPTVEAGAKVTEWVQELGDPQASFYTYNIRTGYCEGDTI